MIMRRTAVLRERPSPPYAVILRMIFVARGLDGAAALTTRHAGANTSNTGPVRIRSSDMPHLCPPRPGPSATGASQQRPAQPDRIAPAAGRSTGMSLLTKDLS